MAFQPDLDMPSVFGGLMYLPSAHAHLMTKNLTEWYDEAKQYDKDNLNTPIEVENYADAIYNTLLTKLEFLWVPAALCTTWHTVPGFREGRCNTGSQLTDKRWEDIVRRIKSHSCVTQKVISTRTVTPCRFPLVEFDGSGIRVVSTTNSISPVYVDSASKGFTIDINALSERITALLIPDNVEVNDASLNNLLDLGIDLLSKHLSKQHNFLRLFPNDTTFSADPHTSPNYGETFGASRAAGKMAATLFARGESVHKVQSALQDYRNLDKPWYLSHRSDEVFSVRGFSEDVASIGAALTYIARKRANEYAFDADVNKGNEGRTKIFEFSKSIMMRFSEMVVQPVKIRGIAQRNHGDHNQCIVLCID